MLRNFVPARVLCALLMVAACGAGRVAYAQPGAGSVHPTASHAAIGGSGIVQIGNRRLLQALPPDREAPLNGPLRSAPFANDTSTPATATPQILEVSLDSGSGEERWYPPRRRVEVTVRFDRAVRVSTLHGTPWIGLRLGTRSFGRATYVAGSGSQDLIFHLAVADWNQDLDAVAIAADSLNLNGGPIRQRASLVDASLAHGAVVARLDNAITRLATPVATGQVAVADRPHHAVDGQSPSAEVIFGRDLALASGSVRTPLPGLDLRGEVRRSRDLSAGHDWSAPTATAQAPVAEQLRAAESVLAEARSYRVAPAGGEQATATSNTLRAASSNPSRPFLFAFERGQSRIDLQWSRERNAGITNYLLEVSDDGVTDWATLQWEDDEGNLHDYHPASTPPQSNKYTHAGLEPGTTRHYRVKARIDDEDDENDVVVESEWSRVTTATTNAMVSVPECSAAFWSAEITVSEFGAFDYLGFRSDGGSPNGNGSISAGDFTLGATEYSVTEVYFDGGWGHRNHPPDYHFAADDDPTSDADFSQAQLDEFNDLVLYVGDVRLPFASVTAHSNQSYGHAYRWTSADYEDTFGSPDGDYVVGDRVPVCLIDSSPRVTLKLTPDSISESGGVSTVTASVTSASSTPFAVTVSAAAVQPATANDFTLSTNKTLSFAANATESTGTVTITARDNTLDAADKTITVAGSVPDSAPAKGPADVTLTITDDDELTLSVTASPDEIAEAGGTSTVTVSTGGVTFSTNQTIDLAYGGTAGSGTDYATPPATLTLTAGQSTAALTLRAIDDAIDDDGEEIEVTATYGGQTAQDTVTITDDDAATLSVTAHPDAIAEAGGTSTVTVSTGGVTFVDDQTVALTYRGTATAGTDYEAPPATLTLTAGDHTVTLTLTAKDDTIDDDGETIEITAGHGGQTARDTVTITDDDDLTLSVTAIPDAIAEAGGRSTVTVGTGGVTFTTNQTIDLAYGGTAGSGTDYEAPPGSLTLTAGQSTATLTLTAKNDTIDDDGETIEITAEHGGKTAKETVTITDDDTVTLSVTANPDAIAEAGGESTVTVSTGGVTFATNQTIDLAYGGTAANGTDYEAPPAALTLTAGQSTATLTLTAKDDTIDDDAETIEITATQGSDTAKDTVTITDDDTVTVSIDDAGTVVEGGTARFVVSLSTTSTRQVTVTYMTADGTAQQPGDYTEVPSTTLEFAPGDSRKTISVATEDDALDEADGETFTVTLKNAVNATLQDDAAQGTIDDNDGEPELSLQSVTRSLSESGGSMTFTVNLNAASGKTVTVDYTTVADTAAAGVDFATTAGTLTFTPGVTLLSIPVPIQPDTLNEANETFKLRLSDAENATLAGAGSTLDATGTIVDDDALRVRISEHADSVPEGTAATFTVTLSSTPAGVESTADVVVVYTVGGTATSADYTAPSDLKLTIDSGESSGTITIPTSTDSVLDPGETIVVTLTSAGTAGTVTVDTTAVTTTLVEQDTETVSVTAATATEGAAANFVVTLSGAVSSAVEVTYRTSDGTAEAGSDYTGASDTLTFTVGGSLQRTIAVDTTDDTLNEATENFTLTLTSITQVAGLSLGTASATGAITDNDALAAAVSADATDVDEGSAATFTVDLTAGIESTAPVEVRFTVGGTASSADYTAPSGTLTIAKGATSGTITIQIADDEVVDPGETLEVTLSTATTATRTVEVDTTAVAKTTITDTDAATVAIEDAEAVAEGETASFVVTLSGTVSSAVEVTYATSDGTAAAGSDYTGVSDTLTFSVGGSLQQTIAVDTTDDKLNEASEEFTLTLTSITQVVGLSLGTASATGAITDNDALEAAVSATTTDVDEGSTAKFAVSLTAGIESTAPVEVRYTLGGTASSDDYTAPSGALTIAKGASSGTITIAIANDEVVDPGETLEVTLSSATTATRTVEVNATAARITITDTDTAQISIADAGTVDESTAASFEVTMSTAVGRDVELSYRTWDGTALAGADYGAKDDTLTLAAGTTSATLTVQTIHDTFNEPTENFTVTLTLDTQVSGLSVETGSATAEITDNDALRAAISEHADNVPEGTAATFTVTLSSTPPGVASTADVVVVYTVGGTATSADYTAPSAPRLTIDSGESSGTITIPTSTDSVLDPGETIVVTLTSASTAGTVTVDPTAVTTTLVEQGTETVSVAAATATEGAAANFVVTLSGAVSSAVEVSYRTSDGTAVAGSDYTGASDTLTFSVGGSRQQTIAVDTTDDTLNEATEDFTLTLTSITQVAGLSLGTASATGAITDNDALAAAVSADAANVDEGSAATFTVSLTAGIESTAPVEVRYTLGGTAGSNDYTAPTAPLTIVKGASSGTITIAIADDEVVDPGETLEVTLSAATTATRTVEVDTAAASTTITDADTATVAIANATVTEGDTASFVVTLSLPVESPVEVSFQTAQGSALPGTGNDYLTNSGTLTFSPGKSLQRTIEVTTVEDELSEAEETFTVSLTLNSAIDGLTLGTASATGTIEDDDAVPELALTSVTQRLAESGGSMTFTVSLGAASSRVVTVDFEAVDGTATADQDFAATEGTLTFRPGENRQRSVQVPILDDTMDEDDETFALELSNASNATLAGGRSTLAATGTIEDDDVLRAAVEADALTVVESNPATFTVELTGGTSMADVLVAYTVSGTATAGADYNAPGGILRITEGAASGTITIRTLADDMLDAGETLEVKLVSASSGTRPVTVDTTAVATTTIEDEGTVTVSIDGAAAEEGDTVSFAVALSGAVASPVEVPYETSSGTGATDAGAGADYDVTRGTLTFEPNALEQTIRVATIEDSLNEADETFAVTLTDSGLPAGVSLGTASAAGTITDDDSQSARVGANAVSVTEGRAATFAVTLTGGTSTAAVEVAYSVGGTATAGTDYNAPGGTLTIAAGSDSGTITIVTRTDGVVDPGETLEVQLTGATTATGTVTVVTTAATTTITEADTVMVSVAAATAEEGASLGFTVEMSGAVSTPVEVSWATSSESSDTAVANADYTTARGTLTFSPGQALTQTFIVPSREDTLNEASETFTVTLTASNPPSGVSLGTASATGTITDDDPLQAAVESMTKNVPEGNPAKFAVTLTGGTSTADVVVAYSVAGTATAGSDYTAPSGTLTLQPEATSATLTIVTRTDDILDPGETLVVTLDSATTAGAATVNATATTATATITQAGSVTVAVADGDADEGESVSFAVTLSGAVSSAVKVSYQTSSGTEATAADAATDYTAATGTLTFNPGASLEQTISVATTEDALHEADETFTLTLTGVDLPAGVELGDATATGTIEDDDDQPTLTLTSVTQSLAEGGGSMTFTVTLDAATGNTATVDYTTVNGTAESGNGKDYAAINGTLTFSPDGVRQRNLAVRIHQDDLDEDDETFQLKLGNATNATLSGGGSTLAVTRTIVDDDVLKAAVTEVAKNVTEGNPAKFAVDVTGGTSTASVVVAYTVGGTATAGSDYTAPSGTLMIAAGAATGTIAIATLTDQALDAGETLEVRLVSASTATRIVVIDATKAATTSIVDAGAVTVSVADVTVTEGTTASFKVTLSESVADPVEVTYETSSGTGTGDAEVGADYPVTSGTLTFSQGGSLEQTIRVPTTQDNLNEASEVFKVTLEGPDLPAGVVLGDAEATGTITDDDPLRVTLRAEAQNVDEGQPASFTVTVRDNTSTADVVVDYSVAGTAEQDVDYTAPNGSLTIRQGKSSGTIAITTLTDDVLDPDETLEVRLTRATTAGRSVSVDTTTVTTTLAEQSTVTVSLRGSTGGGGDVTADEGEPLQFTVNLSGTAAIAVEVPYQTANGTAAGRHGLCRDQGHPDLLAQPDRQDGHGDDLRGSAQRGRRDLHPDADRAGPAVRRGSGDLQPDRDHHR